MDFKNEVAVIAGAGEISGIEFIPFSEEEMVVLIPPQHPLTKKEAIFFHELKDEPFIMKDKGSGTRKLVDLLFAQNSCKPNILMEVSNSEFIKQLVQRGDGVSFLVREVVAAELSEGLLASVPLKEEKIYLDVSIAYLTNQHLSPPAKAFVNTLKQLRSGRAMRPVRNRDTVRRPQSGEIVPLHGAGKALADRGADDVDHLPGHEMGRRQFGAEAGHFALQARIGFAKLQRGFVEDLESLMQLPGGEIRLRVHAFDCSWVELRGPRPRLNHPTAKTVPEYFLASYQGVG